MNYIEKALSQQFGSLWQLQRIYHEEKPVGTSTVYRAISDDGGQVAVKLPPNPAMTRNQYHALRQLSDAHDRCVRAMHLDPDGRFFVMEWVNAPTLKEKMLDPDRLDLIRRAGGWLNVLHRRTRAMRPTIDAAFEDGLQTADNPRFVAVDQELSRRRRALWLRRSRPVLLHTDYQLNNLFLSQGEAVGFDPAVRRRGHRYFDVAHFLLTSRLFRLRADYLGAPWPDDAATDDAAFFDGYGAIPAARRAMFDFIMDLRAARSWRRKTAAVRKAPVEAVERDFLDNLMRERGLLDG